MLTEKEKQEMLQDALDPLRRQSFRQAYFVGKTDINSLDRYVQFLQAVHQVFPIDTISRKKTLTSLNLL